MKRTSRKTWKWAKANYIYETPIGKDGKKILFDDVAEDFQGNFERSQPRKIVEDVLSEVFAELAIVLEANETCDLEDRVEHPTAASDIIHAIRVKFEAVMSKDDGRLVYYTDKRNGTWTWFQRKWQFAQGAFFDRCYRKRRFSKKRIAQLREHGLKLSNMQSERN